MNNPSALRLRRAAVLLASADRFNPAPYDHALSDLLVSMAETLEMGHLRDRATWEMADLLADKILGGAA